MRKSSRFMGALAVGALAVGVSVYAAPRADRPARGKESDSRLVTGASQQLQAVIDGGVATFGDAFVGITGVDPTDGSSYAAGVQLDGAGDFTLDGADAQLWFEIQLGNWDGTLDTYQISIDQASFNNGVGADLSRPVVNCDSTLAPPNDAAPCVAAYGPGSKCTDVPADPNDLCDIGYQDATNSDFAINGISAVNQPNLGFGSTKLPGFSGEADVKGTIWYGGNLTLNANSAAGTYTVGILANAATFLVLSTGEIQIVDFNTVTIDVPLGRCCVLSDSSCAFPVTKAACDDLGGLHQVGPDCTTACIECDSGAPDGGDAACDDGDICTNESCGGDNFCIRSATFDEATECCDGSTGVVTVVDDGDPCTDDSCDGTGACGTAGRDGGTCGTDTHSPSATGTPCDDGNACTFADECDAGTCAGTDANTVPCATDQDCLDVTGGALECQASGLCFCTLSPALTWDIDSGDAVDPNCFDDGEKVTATAQVGPSLDVITGGELAISYDASCLTLNGVITIAPFNNILFIDTDTPGEIYIAVGIDLGGVGVGGGNFDLIAFSFAKAGGCAACDLCFTDVNPRRTRLTNDLGQAVTVQPECSKEVRGDGVLTLDTPGNTKANTACGHAYADVSWPTPGATDTCQLDEFWCGGLYQSHIDGSVVDVGVIGVDPMGGGRFPIGDSTFCCNAANDCGETSRECWTVTVNDATSLDVDIALSPTMATVPYGLERCIKFELFSNCTSAPLVFSENVTFGGLFDLAGKVNTSIKIPEAGQFGCITARDQLHTLRSCYTFGAGDCDADGVLHATFKGDPFFGGNWLVGGNLDGYKKESATASLDAIDITDFGMFVSQYPAEGPTGNTDCTTEGPHADINGDGNVDLLDFTFITMNFLEDSKDCCCPGSAARAPSGRTSISSRAEGMWRADLNKDGVVNMTDMSLFLNGVRPPKERDGALR